MFKAPSAGLFVVTLVVGMFLAIMSGSWFGVWAGLELNLLSFIPLMLMNGGGSAVESGLKYFLVQACGSFLVLYSGVVVSSASSLLSTVLFLSLVLKSGGGPFHSWLPMVTEGLKWGLVGILFSVQKVAPLVLIWYLKDSVSSFVFSSVVFLSAFAGAAGGVNEMSLRKMLAFSSVSHFSWLCLGMSGGAGVWFVYFASYCFMVLSLISLLSERQWYYLRQLSREDLTGSLLVGYSFMSLGGLPPFLGFFPKWGVLVESVGLNSLFLSSVVIMTSLMALFYYVRASLGMFLNMKSRSLSMKELSGKSSLVLVLNLVGIWSSGTIWVFSL